MIAKLMKQNSYSSSKSLKYYDIFEGYGSSKFKIMESNGNKTKFVRMIPIVDQGTGLSCFFKI